MKPSERWSEYIEGLKGLPIIKDEEKAARLVADTFKKAVEERVKSRFGILFSGGVDSTLIAWLTKDYDCTCYTVGMEGSPDILSSKKVANELGLRHEVKILDMKELERLFERTADMLGEAADVVNVGVGAVEVAALDMADTKHIFSGLGSEEIFAGYQRHSQSQDINEECWNGLSSMWKTDLMRDYYISKEMGVEFLTPFLDEEVMKAAMSIDGSLKIQERKKHILRKAAMLLGLKEEFAMRPKKAAQYGSRFDKALAKIAKKKGLKKREYIKSL